MGNRASPAIIGTTGSAGSRILGPNLRRRRRLLLEVSPALNGELLQGGLFEMKAEILTGVGKIPKTKTPVEIFSTCPQSYGATPEGFRDNVAQVARWCERYGCNGMLIYTDNSMVDPWL